jgi:predicted kinase
MERQVVLVVGAPCAGKTTYVEQNALPGDLIIDWDSLAMDAGSSVAHDHAPQYRSAATAARKELEQRVASGDLRAWVIRTLPNPADRPSLMRRLNATELVEIDPGLDVCLARARAAGRPADLDAVILKWYGLKYGARNYGVSTGWQSQGLPANDPRRSGEWKRVCAIVRRNGGPCRICGNPIRYDLRKPHKLSFSVDHIVAVTRGGAWFDLSNLQAAHYGCNSGKGNRAQADSHRTSEAW